MSFELPDEVIENLIIEQAYKLIGLGAPNKDDMQGFNKPDWAKMEYLLPSAAARGDAEISKAVFYHIASTLEKYHRQIDEFSHEQIVKYARKHQTNRSYDAVKFDVDYESLNEERKSAVSPKQKIGAKLLAMNTVELSFDYSKAIVDEVRNIPERRYNALTKSWTFPLVHINAAIELLDKFGCDELRDIYDDNFETVKALMENLPPSAIVAASAADLKKIHVKHVGAILELRFAKNFAISNTIKTMRNWCWVPDALCWTVPIEEAEPLHDALRDAGFDVSEFVPFLPKHEALTIIGDRMDFTRFPGLFEHQKTGINFLLTEDGMRGRLLGDDMGLGKTRQSVIAAYEAMCQIAEKKEGVDKILVVVPASLKLNWEREIHTVFEGADVYIPSAVWDNEEVDFANWIVINYDILKKHEQEILAREWAVMIFDEAHYLKNTKALRSKIVTGTSRVKAGEKKYEGIVHKAEKVILLTGTPITSRPIDLFNLLRICGHSLGNNYTNFARRYCEGERTRFGFQANGASNLSELYRLTRDVILRRLKEDCLDLPEKMRHMIPVEVDLTEYNRHWTEYKRRMAEEGKIMRAEHLTRMIKLKTAAAISKIPAAIELIDDLIESDQKVIVFTNFQGTVDMLMQHYGEQAVKVTGEVTGENRQKAVDEFQTNPNIKVFVGNIKAAGVGLTLTAATHEIMLDYSWVPSDHLQAEDRAYRIGQKNAVTVHYINAVGTMDEKLSDLLAHKLEVISNAIEGKSVADNSVFGELVTMLWGNAAIAD